MRPHKGVSVEVFSTRASPLKADTHALAPPFFPVCLGSFDIGFVQWNHRLQCLISLQYPIMRSTRASLASLYYHVVLVPGLDARLVELAAQMAISLLQPRRKISIRDVQLPWKPLYDMLNRQLFPKARQTGLTGLSNTLMDLATTAQRFFPASEAEVILHEVLPLLDGSNINSVIGAQAFLVHFLPLSKPQRWLPAMFKLWESFESGMFDDQMLDLLARLAVLHSNPDTLSRDSVEDPSKDPGYTSPSMWREIGLLTKEQFALVMTKALRSAGLPVGSTKVSQVYLVSFFLLLNRRNQIHLPQDANAALMAQSAGVRSGSDAQASGTILSMKKPTNRASSLAKIIVHSMMIDGPATETENADPAKAGSTSRRGDAKYSEDTDSALNEQEHFLAGSRALDALNSFFQATETYFHPSNWGPWQYSLNFFLAELATYFLDRWKLEQKSDCKTPIERRLTPSIKREFVGALRGLCFMSMFGKDMLSLVSCQAALKRLALLEPELILPAILERAYPGLEELETTHRTTAIITTLKTLAPTLVSRHLFPAGGKHLMPLLQLCLPAIDPTDFAKTICGCAFIINAFTTIRLDDLTRPELGDDEINAQTEGDALREDFTSRHEEDLSLRTSTAGAEEWVSEFFGRLFAVFSSLPDEGAKGKVGGKQEEQVSVSLLSATEAVVASLSPYLVQRAWDVVFRHVSETVSASSSRLMASVVGSCARANPSLILDKMIPLADSRLRAEISFGASSARTTSTHTASPGDAAYHWHLSCLGGALTGCGDSVLKYRKPLLSLLGYLVVQTRSERGYTILSRIVGRLLSLLVGIYLLEWKPFNDHEWNDQVLQKSAHLHWGKVYEAKDVKLTWHVPSEEGIDFALEILDQLVQPALQDLDQMQNTSHDRRDKIWSNDFCRKMSLIKHAFSALASAVQDSDVGNGQPASDIGDECMEFIASPPRFRSGFSLRDPSSGRYKAVVAFRDKVGEVLYRCATSSRASDAEDKQDCIKLLLRTVRAYTTDYAYDAESYNSHSRSLSWYRSVYKLHPRQKKLPRSLWAQRAAWYHQSRGRMNSFYRKRTQLYDRLLTEVVLEYCMSTYVGIRQTAQRTLEKMASLYDGTRQLCFARLIEVIRPGMADDQVKGALYVLGSKGFSNAAIIDARLTSQYVLCLLNAQHHPKPSLQKLVRGLLNDFAIRFVEPSTLRFSLNLPKDLLAVVQKIETGLQALPNPPPGSPHLDLVLNFRQARIGRIDAAHSSLVPAMMTIASDPSTHWSFALYAARLLRAMIRRDQPLSVEMALFFVRQLHADNPVMRKYATGALNKMLFFAKVRTLAKDDQDLVLGKTTNPLKREVTFKRASSSVHHTTTFESFMQPLVPGQTKLVDKSALGWLAWGETETYYDLPDAQEAPWRWDPSSVPALEALREVFLSAAWWEKQLGLWAQEKQRNYVASENFTMMKSIAQVFGVDLIPRLGPIVERFIMEKDRHKHRAASETLIGLIRGSKHWPLNDQSRLWEWFTPLLPHIYKEATQDSQPVWEDMMTHTFDGRDPRRAIPLLHFAVSKMLKNIATEETEPEDSLQMQSRAHSLFRCALFAVDRKLTMRQGELIQAYSQSFDVAFSEIRFLLSDNLANLELFSVAPSYASVDAFLEASRNGTRKEADKSDKSATVSMSVVYRQRFEKLHSKLSQWKSERRPTSHGSSRYDNASLTALLWISATFGDHRRSEIASFAIDFLPSVFEMLELKDNVELSKLARAALTKISTYHYGPGPLPAKLVQTLLKIMSESQEWRVRLDALPILQVAYFQNLFYLCPSDVREIVNVLLTLLKDAHLEVREMAATTLSGVVRCSQRGLISDLKERFTETVVASTPVPRRGEPGFHEVLATLHSGILGAVALLTAFPYDVPSWMPSLLIETVCRHTESPPPVSNTVKKCAAEWRRTHQDSWSEVVAKLTTDELQEVNMWVLGRSDYYA